MHIVLESQDKHTIQAYTETQIKINQQILTDNFIVTPTQLIPTWPVSQISELNHPAYLEQLIQLNAEVILIGQPAPVTQPPPEVLAHFSRLRIGLEWMSIGSACRTFNLLLNEGRAVAACFLLKTKS